MPATPAIHPAGEATTRGDRAVVLRVAALAAVLLLAAALRLWNLDQVGFGNIYYAATVRSMAGNWHNFLYAAFDPAGFVSVDKPPVAFWIQALLVRLLGYDGLSLHVPQATEGILAVVLVYVLTRSAVGPWGGLLAGVVMAVSPANVAADRSNLADSCLVLILLAAAWAMLRATETGRPRWLLASMILAGVGFNTKLTAAYLVLPAFYVLYLVAAPVGRMKRVAHWCLATVVLAAVSLSWPIVVDLTPAASRPYVGDSPDNSAVSLALGRRSFSAGRPPGPPAGRGPVGLRGTGPRRARPKGLHAGPSGFGPPPAGGDGPPRPGRPPGGGFPGIGDDVVTGHGGAPGPLRLLHRDLAGHIAWWIPFAVVGLIAMAAGRTLLRRRSTDRAVGLFGVWFLMVGVAFSLLPGPVHPYYLSLAAPALAVLVGIAAVYLWRAVERGVAWTGFPIAAVGLTALCQGLIAGRSVTWAAWLLPVLTVGAAVSVGGMLFGRAMAGRARFARRAALGGLILGLATLIVCPAAWSATPGLAPGGRMVPLADPCLLEVERVPETELWRGVGHVVDFLRANRPGEPFLLAVPDIHLAAPIIIRTGESVMAYGGFTGMDPILTAEEFAARVEAGQVRYVMLAGRGPMSGMGQGRSDAIDRWVRAHGVRVPPDRWRPPVQRSGSRLGRPPAPWGPTGPIVHRVYSDPGVRLYDCRPALTPRGARVAAPLNESADTQEVW